MSSIPSYLINYKMKNYINQRNGTMHLFARNWDNNNNWTVEVFHWFHSCSIRLNSQIEFVKIQNKYLVNLIKMHGKETYFHSEFRSLQLLWNKKNSLFGRFLRPIKIRNAQQKKIIGIVQKVFFLSLQSQ